MAAALEDLRAGEITLFLSNEQPYRDFEGYLARRSQLLPMAMIRARGTTNPDPEYMLPAQEVFGDMLYETNATGGDEQFNRSLHGYFPAIHFRQDGEFRTKLPPNDTLGVTVVHWYPGV